ncbi:MAG: hypothetical protein HOE79_05540 [Euryarchaeota archaeon]|jgi:hypothetical protein|nr:hypothetical protein [Euryarchaeota archaeon]
MGLNKLYAELMESEPSALVVVSAVALIACLGHSPWKKGFTRRIIGTFVGLCSAFIWIVIIGTFGLYLDGYLGVGFTWSCGTLLFLIAIIFPFAPFMNINVHYVTLITEKGLIYAIKNWKLPITLGIEQSKRFLVEVIHEVQSDSEVRKIKAEKEERQRESDRRFLLDEEE